MPRVWAKARTKTVIKSRFEIIGANTVCGATFQKRFTSFIYNVRNPIQFSTPYWRALGGAAERFSVGSVDIEQAIFRLAPRGNSLALQKAVVHAQNLARKT